MTTDSDPHFPALTPAQRYHFEVYGYVLIENAIDKERVQHLLRVVREISQRLQAGEKVRGLAKLHEVFKHRVVFSPLGDCDPEITSYLCDPLLLSMARELVGGSVRFNCATASLLTPDPAASRVPQYGFHLGVRPGWGTYYHRGLFHTSMVRTFTYLTDVGPHESTAFIAGSHKIPQDVSCEEIIACAKEDERLIHTVTAKAGGTVLFSESTIHSSPALQPSRERVIISGCYTPTMYQPWMQCEHPPESLEAIAPEQRAMFSGSEMWAWKQCYRPALGTAEG